MNYLILIPLGFIPSLLWLFYYLRKDPHPEPRGLVLQVFLLGMLIVFFAAFLEILAAKIISSVAFLLLLTAFIEEYFKYWIVRWRMLRDSALDEPTDAMIYLIIAGLGFAAVENIFYLQKFFRELMVLHFSQEAIFQLAFLRFITATFLHALASGLVGYFWALSLLSRKKIIKATLVLSSGLVLATLFHALYNYLILAQIFILIPILLYILAIFIAAAFRKLRVTGFH